MVGTQRTHQRPARVSVCPHRSPHTTNAQPYFAYRIFIGVSAGIVYAECSTIVRKMSFLWDASLYTSDS